MKPAIVNGKPENGENCSSIETSAPASAALAKPSTKLVRWTRSTSTPTMNAASRRSITARIARPAMLRERNQATPMQVVPATTSETRRLPVIATLPRCQTSLRDATLRVFGVNASAAMFWTRIDRPKKSSSEFASSRPALAGVDDASRRRNTPR